MKAASAEVNDREAEVDCQMCPALASVTCWPSRSTGHGHDAQWADVVGMLFVAEQQLQGRAQLKLTLKLFQR